MTYFSKLSEQQRPRKLIGFIGFDGVTTLDLTGPLEAFANARLPNQTNGECGYETIVISAGKKTFVSQSGVVFKAQHTLATAPQFDTIIVPGGSALLDPESGPIIAAWLQSRATTTHRFASVSGGIYALARAGLLDGRPVTTHWKFAQNVARQFPTLQMNTAATFVKHEAFYTCGGGTAGIEMSLALIEEDYGVRTALGVARELVMSLRPAAGQDHEDAFDYQPGAEDQLAELPGWITSRLRQNLSVEVLAERACLCPRHFSRVFKQTFQSTPADFVELLRIKEAARRLVGHRDTIESIATSVGFKSAEVFRRAFERRFGMTPRQFQKRNPKPTDAWTNARRLQRN